MELFWFPGLAGFCFDGIVAHARSFAQKVDRECVEIPQAGDREVSPRAGSDASTATFFEFVQGSCAAP
jgi:hypothetical protein